MPKRVSPFYASSLIEKHLHVPTLRSLQLFNDHATRIRSLCKRPKDFQSAFSCLTELGVSRLVVGKRALVNSPTSNCARDLGRPTRLPWPWFGPFWRRCSRAEIDVADRLIRVRIGVLYANVPKNFIENGRGVTTTSWTWFGRIRCARILSAGQSHVERCLVQSLHEVVPSQHPDWGSVPGTWI